MNKRVVVTGVGSVTAYGASVEENRAQLRGEGRIAGETVTLGAGASLDSIRGLDSKRFVPGRLAKKLDRFTIYGLCAAGAALESAGVAPSNVSGDRIGVFVGNCLAGWGFTEPELRLLHTRGVKTMSAYVATAWFPAALQGQVSLAHDLKGYSKTFSAGGVAGIQALGYAYESIRQGRADVVVAGAAEDLSSRYVQAILSQYRQQSGAESNVFGSDASSRFAEGAAFLVLEEAEHAATRGANVLCEVTGFADNFCPNTRTAVPVVRENMTRAVQPGQEDTLFVLDGAMDREEGLTREAMSSWAQPVDLVATRHRIGNMFALSGVLEAACAASLLRDGSLTAQSLGAVGDDGKTYSRVGIRRLSARGAVSSIGLSRAA